MKQGATASRKRKSLFFFGPCGLVTTFDIPIEIFHRYKAPLLLVRDVLRQS